MQHLLLLHGAIGAADQLMPLASILEEYYNIHTLNFPGHGGAEMPIVFSIAQFADDVLRYIESNEMTSVTIFGYSMGGYVAMQVAKQMPHRVNGIITLATKFHWDPATAIKEIGMLQADKIEQKLPGFAIALQRRHHPNDWREILKYTREMLERMGQDNPLKLADYADIHIPVLVLIGDRDKMITLEETLAVFHALPDAQMGMIPNTGHPIESVNLEILGFMIRNFTG